MEKLVSSVEIERKALELVKVIKEDADYQEYLKLKEKVKDNKDIMEKIAKIKELQKEQQRLKEICRKIKELIKAMFPDLMRLIDKERQKQRERQQEKDLSISR